MDMEICSPDSSRSWASLCITKLSIDPGSPSMVLFVALVPALQLIATMYRETRLPDPCLAWLLLDGGSMLVDLFAGPTFSVIDRQYCNLER